jgi:Heavy-metal-associated domain
MVSTRVQIRAAVLLTLLLLPCAAEEGEQTEAILLDVGSMKCGGCSAAVKRLLSARPEVQSASVNLVTGSAVVTVRSPAQPGIADQLGGLLTAKARRSSAVSCMVCHGQMRWWKCGGCDAHACGGICLGAGLPVRAPHSKRRRAAGICGCSGSGKERRTAARSAQPEFRLGMPVNMSS